jgi:glucose-6-phosphate isomerase
MSMVRPQLPHSETSLRGGLPTNGFQLADEVIEINLTWSQVPAIESWNPLAELQSQHLVTRAQIQGFAATAMAVRGQLAAERECLEPRSPVPLAPAGFIDLPQRLLDGHRRKGESSELGRILSVAARLREEVDRVVILGTGAAQRGPQALLHVTLSEHHNELPDAARMTRPRFSFAGLDFDPDALQDMLDLIENTCVDPELRTERWGAVVTDLGGGELETAAALRVFRSEAGKFYGQAAERWRRLIVPVAANPSVLRDLCLADGYTEDDILTIPPNVGARFSILTAAGLLPAALAGCDVKALLLGAAAMTRRFFEEPFERNPVLQWAVVHHLLWKVCGKPIRVAAFWSRRLAGLGPWYAHILAETLNKLGQGVTPLILSMPQDIHSLGQMLQEGPRDKVVDQFIVRSARHNAVTVGMADRNEDGLNAGARKTWSDLQAAAYAAHRTALVDTARPVCEVSLPMVSEHVVGQLLQMLMLATVVEARLANLPPYGEPGLQNYRTHLRRELGLN